MKQYLAIVALLALSAPAVAAPVDQNRLYVSDPKACALLKTKGVGAFEDLDFTAMSFADGIQGTEFNCNFYGTMVKTDSDDVLVEAICEEPGFKYPDLISIAPWDETRVQVGSMYDLQQALTANASGETAAPAENDGQAAGITLYSPCAGMSALPRD